MTSKLARIALVATIVLGVGAVPASAKKGPKKVPIITFATMYGVAASSARRIRSAASSATSCPGS